MAGAIVNDQGEVLAIRRRDNGHWEPPGGVLELQEALHAGLVREVEEETGLIVEPERLTGIYQNLPRGIVAFVFRCKAVGGVLTASVEAAEVAWLTPSDVADRMDEAYAVRLLDALLSANENGPVIRLHDGHRLLELDETV